MLAPDGVPRDHARYSQTAPSKSPPSTPVARRESATSTASGGARREKAAILAESNTQRGGVRDGVRFLKVKPRFSETHGSFDPVSFSIPSNADLDSLLNETSWKRASLRHDPDTGEFHLEAFRRVRPTAWRWPCA